MTILNQYVRGDITVNAGTASSSPLVTTVSLGDVMLHSISLRIPPGHQGFTGIQWRQAGTTIVPFGANTDWVIGNDDRETFTVESEVDAGFQVITYNTDLYNHTFYIRYVLTPIAAAGPQLAAPIQIMAIS